MFISLNGICQVILLFNVNYRVTEQIYNEVFWQTSATKNYLFRDIHRAMRKYDFPFFIDFAQIISNEILSRFGFLDCFLIV